jgi:hypothetical protein
VNCGQQTPLLAARLHPARQVPFPKEEADAIASFLTPMLRLHPDKRAKASDLVHHNWLDGVLVRGDVIRRAEGDEARRRRREAAGGVIWRGHVAQLKAQGYFGPE